jgi:molybdopterin-binding protein
MDVAWPAGPMRIARGPNMKLSARNILPGKIVDVVRGQTTAHVRIEIAPGMVITSSITMESVDDLKLKVGDKAYAIIKSSEVIVGKD